MKRPDELDARLRHEAQRRGVTVSELTREAIETLLQAPRGRRRLLAAISGATGRRDISERIEERAARYLISEPVAAADWMRMVELVSRYRDLPLGTVDASVISAAERLGTTEIATLDRRHFTVVTSDRGELTLLP